MPSSGHWSRNRDARAELLAVTAADPLRTLAERIAEQTEVTVVMGPEAGLLAVEVREPVAEERFLLGDVLVTRAEVEVGGERGWAMRLGDDRVGALAAAICDASLAGDGPLADEVRVLLDATETDRRDTTQRLRDELAPTMVVFDEMDG